MVASDSFQFRLMLDEKAWNAIANQELPIEPLLHLPTSTFKNGLQKKPPMKTYPEIDASNVLTLVELCRHTHAVIACWLCKNDFSTFDSLAFNHVFLREPQVWVNFLLAMGIGLKLPSNMDDIILSCFTNGGVKPILNQKESVCFELVTTASISAVKVDKYIKAQRLVITNDL